MEMLRLFFSRKMQNSSDRLIPQLFVKTFLDHNQMVKYDLNNSKRLKRAMNEALIRRFAHVSFYQSRWLVILIGISKIINAVVLMGLYMWQVPWEEKLSYCLFFVFYSCLTYFVEYGISVFWWPNYYRILQKDNVDKKFILCTSTPFYEGTFKVVIYLTNSTSYFQRLSNPIYDQTYTFTDYFTESGLMLSTQWEAECDRLIQAVLKSKLE